MKSQRLLVMLLLLAVSGAAEAAEPITLNGPELAERMAGYEVLAGVSNEMEFNFMVVAYSNGTRELYWNDGLKSGADTGTHRIVGDQLCVTWKNSFAGKELCYDVYRIGDNKYQSFRDGQLAFSYYKIR